MLVSVSPLVLCAHIGAIQLRMQDKPAGSNPRDCPGKESEGSDLCFVDIRFHPALISHIRFRSGKSNLIDEVTVSSAT